MRSSERGIMLQRQRVDAWASKLKVTPRLVRGAKDDTQVGLVFHARHDHISC